MPIPIRYTTTNVSSSVRLGNIALGVNAIGYGPSTTTGWANGVGATYDGYAGGFVIYYLSGTNIRIRTADTFTLITVAGQIMNATYASNAAALAALTGAGYTVINTVAPPNLVTDGLAFNLNAGLIMSYPQTNGTWYDISGNANNGTLTNGPTFDSIGAIVFDGTNDYINCGNASSVQVTVGSISALVKTSTPGSSFRSIIAKQNSWGLFVNNGVLVTYDWGNVAERSTGINIADGKWKQVTMTFTQTVGSPSNNAIVYLNGVAVLTTTVKYLNNTINLQIAEANANQFLNGSIANAQVYNRVLSASEVLQNYYQGNIVTSGLVMALDAGNLVSYPATGTAWTALTGSINGTLINGPTFNSGNGGSIVFDGVNDYVTYSSLLNVSNTFTINCWIKPTSNIRQTIVSNGYPYQTNKGFFMTCPGNNSTDFFISLGQDQKIAVSGTGMITTGVWQMVTACVNGASELIKLYVNGIETTYSAQTDANITLQYDTGVFTTGCRNGTPGSDSLYSNFTTLQIYNKALSATEVRQNFNAQRNRFNL